MEPVYPPPGARAGDRTSIGLLEKASSGRLPHCATERALTLRTANGFLVRAADVSHPIAQRPRPADEHGRQVAWPLHRIEPDAGEAALVESMREGRLGGELHRAVGSTRSSGRGRGIASWETESWCGKRCRAKPARVAQSSSIRITDATQFPLNENDPIEAGTRFELLVQRVDRDARSSSEPSRPANGSAHSTACSVRIRMTTSNVARGGPGRARGHAAFFRTPREKRVKFNAPPDRMNRPNSPHSVCERTSRRRSVPRFPGQ